MNKTITYSNYKDPTLQKVLVFVWVPVKVHQLVG